MLHFLVELKYLISIAVVVKNPADFIGAHLGGSEEKTKGILASTVGKVLVIDEVSSSMLFIWSTKLSII